VGKRQNGGRNRSMKPEITQYTPCRNGEHNDCVGAVNERVAGVAPYCECPCHAPSSTFTKERNDQLLDPSTPYWVKDLIKIMDMRDVVDVLAALEDLITLFELKFEEIGEVLRDDYETKV
jgi:hypothetical protein